MFEIIGLLLGAAVFFGLSAVLGVIFGGTAWLVFRQRTARLRRTLMAAMVPPLCAVYMAICLIVFPGVSLFGDISEPLPNGYVLKALGKMPEYGDIDGKTPLDQPQMAGWIDKVDLDGSTLFGTYSTLFADQGSWSPHVVKPCCFAFDTRSKRVQNFDSIQQMELLAGKRLVLINLPSFRSQEPAHVRLVRMEHLILFLPPCALVFAAWVFLFWWRRDMPSAETI